MNEHTQLEAQIADDPLIRIWEHATDSEARPLLGRFCLALFADDVPAVERLLLEITFLARPWARNADPALRAAAMAAAAITAPWVGVAQAPEVAPVARFLEMQAMATVEKGEPA